MWLSDRVSPRYARIAVLPREVATEVLTAAMSRAGWAVASFMVAVHIPIVIDAVLRGPGANALPLPLALLVVLLALFGYAGWRPSRTSRVVVLVLAGAVVFAFALSLLSTGLSLTDDAVFLLNRPACALVLLTPGLVRPGAALRWTVLEFAVAIATLVAACLVAGVPITTGTGPFIVFTIRASALLVIMGLSFVVRRQSIDLDRLQAETRRLALEHEYEQRAAAVIHDTVLGDLTAVMNSSGAVDERMRERFIADVVTLENGSWLRETAASLAVDATDAELRNGMVALVSEMQWRGLSVDVTGNPEEDVVRLGSVEIAALHAAVRACLENVLQHAGTDSAELILGAAEGEATVMVIDQGRGFDPAAIPGDRLGIRSSIIGRVEDLGGTVRVWSRPGQGTSVLLSMPADVSLGGGNGRPA